MLMEWTTTTVRSTSPMERSVTVGQMVRNWAWSSAKVCPVMRGRYSARHAVASVGDVAQALDGRVIAVAGGAGTLGPTVVQRLASAGSRTCVCGRDQASLDELAAEIEPAIETDVVDLLDPEATKAWAADLAATPRRSGRRPRPYRRRLARRHADRGCAARGLGRVERAPRQHTAARHAGLRAAPVWRATHGRFVIVSAGQAQAPTHPNAAYAAAKAAAEAWTLALADRFKGTGATANIIVVGAIVTQAMRAESPDKDFSTFTPAEEIAEAIAYLVSDDAASMNGQRVTLRGAY